MIRLRAPKTSFSRHGAMLHWSIPPSASPADRPGRCLEGGHSKVAERSHSASHAGGRWTLPESGRSPGALLVFDHVSRYRPDMPIAVPSRESPPLLIGPGIPMQVVEPSLSPPAVLQGTALTTFVEIPSGPTLSKPGPGYTSGTGPPNALSGASGP